MAKFSPAAQKYQIFMSTVNPV